MSATVVNLRTGDKDAVAIGKLCDKARGSMVDSVKYLIEAGQKLIEKKESLVHGEWLPWLKENADALGFSTPQTAGRLMKVGKLNVNAQFGESEASQISKNVWGNTNTKPKGGGKSKKTKSSPKKRGSGKTAEPYRKTRLAIRESMIAGEDINTEKVAKNQNVSVDTVERAALAEQARIDVLEELDVDPETLAATAKGKLEIAKRMLERKLSMEHTARMRGLEEEVRKRVLTEGKEYLTELKVMEKEARETVERYQAYANIKKPLFTVDQFKAVLMCLHPDGKRTADKLNEAFLLFNGKKLQLTGEK